MRVALPVADIGIERACKKENSTTTLWIGVLKHNLHLGKKGFVSHRLSTFIMEFTAGSKKKGDEKAIVRVDRNTRSHDRGKNGRRHPSHVCLGHIGGGAQHRLLDETWKLEASEGWSSFLAKEGKKISLHFLMSYLSKMNGLAAGQEGEQPHGLYFGTFMALVSLLFFSNTLLGVDITPSLMSDHVYLYSVLVILPPARRNERYLLTGYLVLILCFYCSYF